MREQERNRKNIREKHGLRDLTAALLRGENLSRKESILFKKTTPSGFSELRTRRTGELELANPNIASLEPTPITEGAKDKLMSWGMSEEDIKDIQRLTSSFRYDLCPEKAKRIAETGGYIHKKPNGEKEIILPEFFDTGGRFDGQCSDISIQCINLFQNSGFMEDLSLRLDEQGKPHIETYLITGQARTHFKERSNHYWVGLLNDPTNLQEMITIDPSFQEISETDMNGYQLHSATSTNKEQTSPTGVPISPYHEEQDGSWNINDTGKHLTVLGVSFDRKYYYNVGFAEDEKTGIIGPYVEGNDADGNEAFSYYLTPRGEERFRNLDETITEKHLEEMHAIFSELQKMPLKKRQRKAMKLLGESQGELYRYLEVKNH